MKGSWNRIPKMETFVHERHVRPLYIVPHRLRRKLFQRDVGPPRCVQNVRIGNEARTSGKKSVEHWFSSPPVPLEADPAGGNFESAAVKRPRRV